MTSLHALTAAHSAASRTLKGKQFIVDSKGSTSMEPTSWEGPLLSVMRPTWVKVMESEQRIAWLHKIVEKKLCVKDLEAYIKLQHEQLRSENMKVKEEERAILLELMKVKLKDEMRNQRELRENGKFSEIQLDL